MMPLQTRIFVGTLVLGLCAAGSAAQPVTNAAAQTTSPQSEMEAAIHQVEKIVNQPVAAYRRAPGMHVSEYSPGWFHEGATKPDFNTVDVRATQETPYSSKIQTFRSRTCLIHSARETFHGLLSA